MRICIVTVYDSINSGSFWQAYILGAQLERMGHAVFYYAREKKGSSSSAVHIAKTVGGMIKHLRYTEIKNYLFQIAHFRKSVSKFKVINQKSPIYREINCFILGSDTIWNVDDQYFKNTKSVFWGDVFDRSIVSYAGSIGNTRMSVITENPDYAKSVNRWKAISVRDKYTYKVLSSITDKEIKLVCDPTLLFSEKEYRSLCKEREGRYIFLYLFEPLSIEQNRALRKFADGNDLKIICGIKKKSITEADEYIVNNPDSFVKHMLGASYVITDTYHGTVFSVNFSKQFIVPDRGKNKVNEFLDSVGLQERLIKQNEDIIDKLVNQIDYLPIMNKVEEMRNESIQFLESSLHCI